ncbi:MAG: hypothetical protein NZ805_09640 [Armatimonadetes bacterium]|nr:hypothetical protein [Armatimonadota bacterium]MDW8027928.1 hypothetical protein [Armatimonadota bacterium]
MNRLLAILLIVAAFAAVTLVWVTTQKRGQTNYNPSKGGQVQQQTQVEEPNPRYREK